MGFFDSLAANPSGSGIYGLGGQEKPDYGSAMSMNMELRRRDMNDFMKKANFMSDLSMKQNRLQSIYGTNPMASGASSSNVSGGQPMNTFFREDPDRITPLQRETMNLKREDLGIDRSRIAQTSRLGSEKLALDKEGHALDVKKNQQIFDTKQANMERKFDEANKRLALAQDQLNQRANDSNARIELQRAQQEATTARHALDISRKDTQLEETRRMHQAQIDDILARRDQSSNVVQESEANPEGTKKVVTTKKGSKKPGDSLGIR